MEGGGRKGGGRCDQERLCARRDFPLARRASAYKRLADWLPRRPRCLVRYRPGSGRHRLPSGPASREEEAGRIRGLSRAFSRLLRPGMGVALKGRERVVVVFRSPRLTCTDTRSSATQGLASQPDTYVRACGQRRLKSMEDAPLRASPLSLTKCMCAWWLREPKFRIPASRSGLGSWPRLEPIGCAGVKEGFRSFRC